MGRPLQDDVISISHSVYWEKHPNSERGAHVVKNNIVYILCKDILYTLCKHIVYKFLLIEALIFLLNEDRCESDKPVSSGILAYLRQSSR